MKRKLTIDKTSLDQIASALNCPNNCSGNGECDGTRCICKRGFSSFDCSYIDGKSFNPIKRRVFKVKHLNGLATIDLLFD